MFKRAFTIVELLIVIVVIGILAAVIIVSYIGITQSAKINSSKQTLEQVSKALSLYKIKNSDRYPSDLVSAGVTNNNTTYYYNSSDNTWCLETTSGDVTTSINSSNSDYVTGSCTENGLVAWYPFNGNANDQSGNGENGTVTGATLTVGKNGSSNGAYNFNGSSKIVVPDSIGYFKLTAAITVSAWVKPAVVSSFTNNTAVVVWNNLNNVVSPFRLSLCFSAQVCSGWVGASGWHNDSTTSKVSVGNWYNILFVRSAIDTKIFLNGSLVGTFNNGYATDPVTTNNPQGLSIGGGLSPVFSGFSGDMDDVRIYNRALSDSEVQALYSADAS